MARLFGQTQYICRRRALKAVILEWGSGISLTEKTALC
jgi:hypothetical protein